MAQSTHTCIGGHDHSCDIARCGVTWVHCIYLNTVVFEGKGYEFPSM
jgi:hypothetical protein